MQSIDHIIARDAARIAHCLSIGMAEAHGEAQILMAHGLQRSRAWIMSHGRDSITEDSLASTPYIDYLRRRLEGEPIAYILGEREFYGLMLEVNQHVLIPRPETEFLVDTALELLPKVGGRKILDLGTGSGCIAIAMAANAKSCLVLAADNSEDALTVATCNAQRHHIENLSLLHSDWFQSLSPLRFDLIVSNPPYVAAGDRHLVQGDLRYEPQVALTPGDNALESLEHIIENAANFLHEGGWLLLEHGHDQASAVCSLLERQHFDDISTRDDYAGIARVSLGRRT